MKIYTFLLKIVSLYCIHTLVHIIEKDCSDKTSLQYATFYNNNKRRYILLFRSNTH